MSSEEDFLIQRALSDTGVFARHILGFNFDIDDSAGTVAGRRRINEGTGGVRATGAHREMTDFIDDPWRLKLLLSSRESLKSSIAAAYEIRSCLSNPDFQILHGMQTMSFSIEKVNENIRTHFDDPNSKLRYYFGDQRGKVWTKDRLSFRNGSSITVSGVDSSRTGGHYSAQIMDDLQDQQNSFTPEGIQKVRSYFQSLQPMLMPGGTQLVIGTRWSPSDLYGYIIANLVPEDYHLLRLDAGFEPVQDESGVWDLKGTARFPHLSKERLLAKLRVMTFEPFCSQFLNRIVTGQRPGFRREQFQPIRWADWMRNLTCYLVTDAAFALKETACHSVIGLVGLDADDRAYLLDLRVGHLDTNQFLDAFFGVIKKWESKVPINGHHLERVTLNATLRSNILSRAEAEGIKVNLIESPRGVNDLKKDERIRCMQPRFHEKRFFVVDTVPRYYRDTSGQHVLFDPEGEKGEKGEPLPAGQLVDQFIHFPIATRKDIADALADIDRVLPDGTRVCAWSPSAGRRFTKTLAAAREPGRTFSFAADREPVDWYENAARRIAGS